MQYCFSFWFSCEIELLEVSTQDSRADTNKSHLSLFTELGRGQHHYGGAWINLGPLSLLFTLGAWHNVLQSSLNPGHTLAQRLVAGYWWSHVSSRGQGCRTTGRCRFNATPTDKGWRPQSITLSARLPAAKQRLDEGGGWVGGCWFVPYFALYFGCWGKMLVKFAKKKKKLNKWLKMTERCLQTRVFSIADVISMITGWCKICCFSCHNSFLSCQNDSVAPMSSQRRWIWVSGVHKWVVSKYSILRWTCCCCVKHQMLSEGMLLL